MRERTAVDELMQHCKEIGLHRSHLMTRFYRFHRRNPKLLDFLCQELQVNQRNGWRSTSFEMLWHHARWVLTYITRVPGERFAICQNLMPHYARAAVILCPQFNGFFRMKSGTQADKDFGVRLEPGERGSLRRLVWADGTPIEKGWRPSVPYAIPGDPVPRRPPVQRHAA